MAEMEGIAVAVADIPDADALEIEVDRHAEGAAPGAALLESIVDGAILRRPGIDCFGIVERKDAEIGARSEEHTSELQSLMRISYAVFCLKKKQNTISKPQLQNCQLPQHN